MFNIKGFFSRVNNFYTKEITTRSVVREIIKKHTNINIPIESISFKSNNLSLKNISSVIKSTIFIKKQLILDDIKVSLNDKVINNIL